MEDINEESTLTTSVEATEQTSKAVTDLDDTSEDEKSEQPEMNVDTSSSSDSSSVDAGSASNDSLLSEAAVPIPKTKKIIKYNGKRISRSARAALCFPVGRVERHLRHLNITDRICKKAPVYLAAVLEYLTAEVLEIAGDQSKKCRRKRIKPVDILRGIILDADVSALVSGCTFRESGCKSYGQPQIELVRKPKKSGKSKNKASGTSTPVIEDAQPEYVVPDITPSAQPVIEENNDVFNF